MLVPYNDLSEAVMKALVASGAPQDEARLVTEEIVFAESRGKLSHGLNMLDTMINRYKKPRTAVRVIKDEQTSCLIDGGGVVGPVVASFAVDKAIDKTSKFGIAIVGVRNPSPFLTAGYSAWRAAKFHDMVALVMSVAKSKVAPFGTRKPIIGTNPIGFAFPADPHPIVIDMAVTKIPAAEVEIAKREGRPLPENAAYDADGRETTDPSAAQKGALIPFGEYKGSALGVMVELMSGALLEAKCGLRAGDMRGMIFITMKGDIFTPVENVKRLAAQFREDVVTSSSQSGEARLPGDRAEELFNKALQEGVEVSESTYLKICNIGK